MCIKHIFTFLIGMQSNQGRYIMLILLKSLAQEWYTFHSIVAMRTYHKDTRRCKQERGQGGLLLLVVENAHWLGNHILVVTLNLGKKSAHLATLIPVQDAPLCHQTSEKTRRPSLTTSDKLNSCWGRNVFIYCLPGLWISPMSSLDVGLGSYPPWSWFLGANQEKEFEA